MTNLTYTYEGSARHATNPNNGEDKKQFHYHDLINTLYSQTEGKGLFMLNSNSYAKLTIEHNHGDKTTTPSPYQYDEALFGLFDFNNPSARHYDVTDPEATVGVGGYKLLIDGNSSIDSIAFTGWIPGNAQGNKFSYELYLDYQEAISTPDVGNGYSYVDGGIKKDFLIKWDYDMSIELENDNTHKNIGGKEVAGEALIVAKEALTKVKKSEERTTNLEKRFNNENNGLHLGQNKTNEEVSFVKKELNLTQDNMILLQHEQAKLENNFTRINQKCLNENQGGRFLPADLNSCMPSVDNDLKTIALGTASGFVGGLFALGVATKIAPKISACFTRCRSRVGEAQQPPAPPIPNQQRHGIELV